MVVEVEKPLGAFWLDWLYEKLSIFGLEESETAIQEFFDHLKIVILSPNSSIFIVFTITVKLYFTTWNFILRR